MQEPMHAGAHACCCWLQVEDLTLIDALCEFFDNSVQAMQPSAECAISLMVDRLQQADAELTFEDNGVSCCLPPPPAAPPLLQPHCLPPVVPVLLPHTPSLRTCWPKHMTQQPLLPPVLHTIAPSA
jgi:hypothetical protein